VLREKGVSKLAGKYKKILIKGIDFKTEREEAFIIALKKYNKQKFKNQK